MDTTRISIEPINAGSVVDIAYGRIRTLIEDGELGPSARLRQGDLADALAISRTSVREALHRLTAEELVEFKANRGFFVASFKLDAVLDRLELRQLMEPGIARLAAERRSEEHLRELEHIVDSQFEAPTARLAHDLSRTFHLRLAASTGNEQFGKVLGIALVRRHRPPAARAPQRNTGMAGERRRRAPWHPPRGRRWGRRQGRRTDGAAPRCHLPPLGGTGARRARRR